MASGPDLHNAVAKVSAALDWLDLAFSSRSSCTRIQPALPLFVLAPLLSPFCLVGDRLAAFRTSMKARPSKAETRRNFDDDVPENHEIIDGWT